MLRVAQCLFAIIGCLTAAGQPSEMRLEFSELKEFPVSLTDPVEGVQCDASTRVYVRLGDRMVRLGATPVVYSVTDLLPEYTTVKDILVAPDGSIHGLLEAFEYRYAVVSLREDGVFRGSFSASGGDHWMRYVPRMLAARGSDALLIAGAIREKRMPDREGAGLVSRDGRALGMSWVGVEAQPKDLIPGAGVRVEGDDRMRVLRSGKPVWMYVVGKDGWERVTRFAGDLKMPSRAQMVGTQLLLVYDDHLILVDEFSGEPVTRYTFPADAGRFACFDGRVTYYFVTTTPAGKVGLASYTPR